MAHDQHNEPAVLIVEDNDAMANLMQRTLERDGWSVHRAANGKVAKDLISWAVKSGTKAYLAKPFKPEELRDCVRRAARVPVTSP